MQDGRINFYERSQAFPVADLGGEGGSWGSMEGPPLGWT